MRADTYHLGRANGDPGGPWNAMAIRFAIDASGGPAVRSAGAYRGAWLDINWEGGRLRVFQALHGKMNDPATKAGSSLSPWCY